MIAHLLVLCWLLAVVTTSDINITPPLTGFYDLFQANNLTENGTTYMDNASEYFAEELKAFEKSLARSQTQSSPILGNNFAERSPGLSTTDTEVVANGKRQDALYSDVQYKKRGTEVAVKRVKTYHNLEVNEILGSLFPDTLLGKDKDGRLILVTPEEISFVSVVNKWTESTSGCQCKYSSSKNCVCCKGGGCRCTNHGNLCVECGYEIYSSRCFDSGLIVNISSAFRYVSHSTAQRVVATGNGKTIKFYTYDQNSKLLREKEVATEKNFPKSISALSFVESITFGLEGLRKREFLFVFSEFGGSNAVYEVVDQPQEDHFQLALLGKFSRKGSNFDVINHEGRTYIGYLMHGSLIVEEAKISSTSVLFIQIQSMETYDSTSWRFFVSGKDLLLLMRGYNILQMYIFEKGNFRTLQKIQIETGVHSVEVINFPSFKNKAGLVLASWTKISLYTQEEDILFSKTMDNLLEDHFMRAVKTFDGQLPFLIITYENRVEVLEINKLKSVLDRKSVDDYNKWNNSVEALKSELQHSLYKATESRGKLTISSLATFRKPILSQKLTGTVNEDSVKPLKQNLESITRNIQILKRSMDQALKYLKDVIPKSGSSKLITGVKHFYGPKTQIGKLTVEDASLGNVLKDKESLDTILQNLVRKDDERQIKGRKVLSGNVVVKDLRTSTFNSKETTDYITTEEPTEIDGAKYLNGIFVKNDVIMGRNSRTDGIDLSEAVVRQNGNYELGNCYFNSLKTWDGIVVKSDIVNKESFSQLTNSIFKADANVSIPGSVTFLDLNLKKDLTAHSIMNVDANQLTNELVHKSADEDLANIYFEDVIRCNDVDVENKIGNELFPNDFILSGQPFVNFGSKTFDNIKFRDLTVGGYVDHIKTEDLITKSAPEEVEGLKTFSKGIKVLADLHISAQRLDGVDVNLLLVGDNRAQTKKVVVFEESVTAPGVLIRGKVNNMSLEEMAKDLVCKDEFETRITGRKIFMKSLEVMKSVISKSINGKPFDTLVNTRNKHFIKAKKTFANEIMIEKLRIDGLADNTNISSLLQGSLYYNKPYQTVEGHKYFESIFTKGLKVTKTLNHRQFNNLLTKSTDQSISKHLFFEKAAFNHLDVESVHFINKAILNGIDLLHLRTKLRNNISLGDHLNVTGRVVLKDNLRVRGINDYFCKDFNGLLLRNDRLQVLNNDISFELLEINGSATTSALASGNAALLKRKAISALQLRGKNLVSKDVYWEDLHTDELNVRNLVNGVSLRDLKASSIFLDDPNTFFVKGEKHFLNGFDVTGDVNTNSVNDKNLEQTLFSRTTTQNVSVAHSFEHLVAQSIYLQLFNGIDLGKIRQAEKRGEMIIRGPLRFDGFVKVSSVELEGTIHNQKMGSVVSDAVNLKDKKIIITGKKIFHTSPTFSGVNVRYLNANSEQLRMRTDSSPTLKYLVVNGTVSASRLVAGNLVTKNKKSLLSPAYLRDKYVLASEDILSSLKLQTLRVENKAKARTVNGIHLDKMLTKNTNQSIFQSVTFSSIFTKDVFVDGSVNEYKLTDEINASKHAISKLIQGSVVFNKSLNIDGDLVVKGKVGSKGLKLPQDIVLLNEKNRIEGSLSFVSPLVTSYVDSTEQALNKMSLAVLDTSLKSYRKLFQENKESNLNAAEPYSYVNTMKNIYQKECKRTSYLQTVLSNTYVQPFTLDIVSSQNLGPNITHPNQMAQLGTHSPVLIYKSRSDVFMVNSLNFGDCETKVLRWNEIEHKFEVEYSMGNIGHIQQWVLLDEDSFSIYLLGVASGDEKCGIKGSSIWKSSLADRLKKTEDLEAGINAVVDYFHFGKVIYLDVGYSLYKYEFKNGELSEKLFLKHANVISKITSITAPNASKLIVKLREGDIMEIIDGTQRRVIYLRNVVDVALTVHLRRVLFIITREKEDIHRTLVYHEIYEYLQDKNMSLIPISTLNLDGPVILQPLSFSGDNSESFVLALYEKEIPMVYKLGGEPFMKIWEEFPIHMDRFCWVFQFEDSLKNSYLTFGDNKKTITMKMRIMGRKFEGAVLNCK